MGHKTTVFGFIECLSKNVQNNNDVINKFRFDDTYPFLNCFGHFILSYKGSTIPFSQNFKGDTIEEWDEWILQFEDLLKDMEYSAATVIFDSEMKPTRYVRDYLYVDNRIEIFESWLE